MVLGDFPAPVSLNRSPHPLSADGIGYRVKRKLGSLPIRHIIYSPVRANPDPPGR